MFFFPFGFFFLLWIVAGVFGIIKLVARQRAARTIAMSHGLNPEEAAATTLLTPNGLDATYLAANLRPTPEAPTHYTPPPPAPTPLNAAHNVEARIHELNLLKQQGVITEDEYNTRRQAIISEI